MVEVTKEQPFAGPGEMPVMYEGLREDLQPGDIVLVDDGRMVLTVTKVDGKRVQVTATQGGQLRDRVGVSLPARRVRLETYPDPARYGLADCYARATKARAAAAAETTAAIRASAEGAR
jgi:pyruvate kinase